ncbi:hypothetical protein [Magnetospirillum sulfuroxidans]|uniref:FCP1 homology domain-containing protein n=1 Tax=Magnetospirillum sulfuroxidans TaxID=611300 RepID=A0ABS5IGC1_9PROT|nr:hypothetical protein [Magnetospirillum sulfuroxidans]MBR9973484.1 hypothetical protein [Magnetospirillum sulfuroxidans]
MRLYLDVDGTLLRRSGHARLRGDFAPANNLLRFLEWAAAGFDCAWVTSRTRHGGADKLLPVLRQAIGPGEEWDSITAIIKTFATPVWADFKVEAMDMTKDFLWIDDAPEEESLEVLRQAGRQDSWIGVAVDQRPDDLRRVMELVESRGIRQAAE